MTEPYIGEIRMFSGRFIPEGYALANGQELLISQNQTLFDLYGTVFGGDGVLTFALPDMRERTPVHPGTGVGLSEVSLAETSGAEKVILADDETHHQHHAQMGNPNIDGDHNLPEGHLITGLFTQATIFSDDPPNVFMAEESISLGGTINHTGHDNMQPFLSVNFMVALVGQTPTFT